MRSKGRLGVAAVAATLAVSAGAAADAHVATKTRTLLATRAPIRAFAQNVGRIAWIGGNWQVEVRAFRRWRKTVLVGTARPFVSPRSEGVSPHLALAGTRVLWTRSGGGNDLNTDVYVRNAGARVPPRQLFDSSADREIRDGSYFGAVTGAGSGSAVAYSFVDYECVDAGDCTELTERTDAGLDGTFTVTGTPQGRITRVSSGAAALAISGRTIAILPAVDRISPTQIPDVASPSFAAPGATVEIRDAILGFSYRSLTPPGTVRALALSDGSRPLLAVVDEEADGTRTIERYDYTTGALVGSTEAAAGDAIAFSGHSPGCACGGTLVYAVGKQIEAMDATTGAQRMLTASPGRPIGLSVVGRRVAWAVNVHGHGRILALTLP
jgi:hypothetical protein